jgi:hypothetical protein
VTRPGRTSRQSPSAANPRPPGVRPRLGRAQTAHAPGRNGPSKWTRRADCPRCLLASHSFHGRRAGDRFRQPQSWANSTKTTMLDLLATPWPPRPAARPRSSASTTDGPGLPRDVIALGTNAPTSSGVVGLLRAQSTRAARSGLGWFAPVNAAPTPAMRQRRHSHGGRDPRATLGSGTADRRRAQPGSPASSRRAGERMHLAADGRCPPIARSSPPHTAAPRGPSRSSRSASAAGIRAAGGEPAPRSSAGGRGLLPAGFLLTCQDNRIASVLAPEDRQSPASRPGRQGRATSLTPHGFGVPDTSRDPKTVRHYSVACAWPCPLPLLFGLH